jgi:hypothetical protein
LLTPEIFIGHSFEVSKTGSPQRPALYGEPREIHLYLTGFPITIHSFEFLGAELQRDMLQTVQKRIRSAFESLQKHQREHRWAVFLFFNIHINSTEEAGTAQSV